MELFNSFTEEVEGGTAEVHVTFFVILEFELDLTGTPVPQFHSQI